MNRPHLDLISFKMAMGGGGGRGEGILMDTILFVTAYRTGIHQHPYVYNVYKVLKSST